MKTPMAGIVQTTEFELFDNSTGTQLIRTDDAGEAANLYLTLTRDGYGIDVYMRTVIEERQALSPAALIDEAKPIDDLAKPDTSREAIFSQAPYSPIAPRMAPLVRNPKPRKTK